MPAPSVLVSETRASLGPVGFHLPTMGATAPIPLKVQRLAVQRLEAAGYAAAWSGEGVGGKDGLVELAVLLAATSEMIFGTAITNMWARPPQTLHGAATVLSESFPGRFVLGLGAGYPFQAAHLGQDYGSAPTRMRTYVGQMTEPQKLLYVPEVTYPMILGANGPKMLALAGEVSCGAHPTVVPPEYTAAARAVLGPDKLLVIGLPIVPNDDPTEARQEARQFMSERVGVPGSPYGTNLMRLGYSEQEISEPSDRVVDAVVAFGDGSAIAAKVQAHLDAGADHIILTTTVPNYETGIEQLEQLAPSLIR